MTGFLAEVARQDKATWRQLSEGPLRPSPERDDAVHALTAMPVPAPVRTAVADVASHAFTGLGLDLADFPGPLELLSVRSAIEAALFAIAGCDRLSRAHAETLLRPFADAGFASAATALDRVR
ncbi:hypothetical protein [Cellulomonas denverensis]|uniref:hypothetical protein n=1 Tax=Cellulomonas denverensis TaxID=264297 RepID=UPI00144723B3|nr:hypothetical protein [Cellulomonas denverensis]